MGWNGIGAKGKNEKILLTLAGSWKRQMIDRGVVELLTQLVLAWLKFVLHGILTPSIQYKSLSLFLMRKHEAIPGRQALWPVRSFEGIDALPPAESY